VSYAARCVVRALGSCCGLAIWVIRRDHADMELAEGVILDGHYRLRQLLGRGGMGEVWEAEHTRLPKPFAVKFLLGLSKAEPELLMRFKREAEIASRLNHPSIVQVTDFNILADGTAYIAMERLVGEDLRARLMRGPLTLEETREITKQVASALELAHREGIVHRDLKPENIFLCREADGSLRAKVLDFGISKLSGNVTTGTRDDRVLGTPGYMAPEQALGKNSSIDGRTDLFSLATMVYEMLTGKGVFMGETLAELCTKVLYHTPPPLDEVLPSTPRALAVAVSMALSKDPAARQSGIRPFAEAIAGATLGPPEHTSGFSATVMAEPSDAITRSDKPSQAAGSQPAHAAGRLARVAVIAIALLFMIGGAVYLELRDDRVASTPLPPAVPADTSFKRANLKPPQPQLVENTTPAVEVPPTQSTTKVDARGDEPDGRGATHKSRGERADRGKPVALSASVEATLSEAERAVDRGDLDNAIRLARNSLREASSERAYLVMARAYCRQHDVGMVQAMLRNLSATGKKEARKSCQALGVSIP
jgi:serine/threonine protein kinase